MKNYIKKKYDRLLVSSKLLKLKYFYHRTFGEKDIGIIGFNFNDKPHRRTLIQEIINKKNYKSYLEIGCFADEVFSKIDCEKKVGVDPYSGGTIRKTSDQFFLENKENFDCIYIDGLHLYHQVKNDIYNSLNFLNKNGVILLHDCLPNTVYDQAVPRCKYNWNGDVWKAIVKVRTKKDLDVYTCYSDQGIGIIFKRDNKNLLKIDQNDFSKLKFSDYFENYKKYMNLILYKEILNIF
tara:strand:+ start:36 stop:746 length:711 start_codon:yes stop_codon:yes gene_type:complete